MTTAPDARPTAGTASRWWTYQRERFPLAAHGPLIAAFSFCAVAYSHLLREAHGWPAPSSSIVAFLVCLLLFLQLRIADEHKDADEDARWRPYRPVPRGLVSLRELARVGIAAAVIQAAATLALAPGLVLWLGLVWAYFALMSREFFAGEWLRARPLTYLLSHLFIMPLVDVYAAACDWLPAGHGIPSGLGWFVAASYANGLVIEVGRKLRAPADEEPGVATYTALWGRPRAVALWLAGLAAAFLCGLAAAARIGHATLFTATTLPVLALSTVLGAAFLRSARPRSGRRLEAASGIWTLALYLGLGALPLVAARLFP